MYVQLYIPYKHMYIHINTCTHLFYTTEHAHSCISTKNTLHICHTLEVFMNVHKHTFLNTHRQHHIRMYVQKNNDTHTPILINI